MSHAACLMERILDGCDSRNGGRMNSFAFLLKLADHPVFLKGRLHDIGWMLMFVNVMYKDQETPRGVTKPSPRNTTQ